MIDISSFISEDRYKIPQGVRDWDGSRITAPEVGFWDGTKDAIKDILPNAALHVGSALTGMFTGSGRQATIEQAAAEAQEQGIPITDPKEFARKQAEYMDASAKELRRIAEEEYTPNPEATGVAGQIIHGVGTELTKAVLVAPIAAASPQAAALAYGAMHGVETTQRYKDKGVDENTANWLGVSAFGTGTLGFLIPAAAGPTRLASAVYGAITNPAANVSEDLATRMILRKQNYEALAATINPFDPLNLAVAAFVGGGFGTIGFHKKATAATKKAEEKPKEAAQEKPQTLADSVVEGAKTVKKAAAEVPDVSQVQEASTLRMAENGVVLQNRNRGTASSIVQMQQIAGNPIYNMVSVSREFSSGAPVIAFPNNISEGQWGRTEMVSASDGSQMEMRYAVVEADNLQVSNFADGTRNADYGVVKQNVTIAGNGRVAGISAAYERGTAEKYKADLIKDADNVGIKPSVIEGMKEPVLVRVMSDRDAGRPDIAMLSNQSGTKALDATEQAENDAAAIDVSKLTFDENGNITDETVKQFAALVPDNSSLVDRNGIPNTLARPRLERAIFQRAYGDANLTSLLTDTESEGGRVVSIFLKLAPKMMQLEGAGDLDFRDALVAALNEVYVARASGSFKSLKELAASQSLGRTPETQAFLDYLSGVGNQVNAPTQVFARLADWSLANKLQAEGMFADESPLPTRADLMMEFQDLTGVPVDPYVLDMIKAQVTRAQAREKISTTIREKLAAAGQEAEQVEAQSRIWTNAVMHLAELAHRDPLEILPNIDLEGVPSSADGFTMPVTQGRNWQYGDHAAQNPDYRVKVARLSGEKEGVLDNKTAADILNDFVGETSKNRLKNDVTDWVFSISGNDKKEIIHGLSRTTKDDGPDVRADNVAILRNLPEVIKNAFPAESYRDIKAAQGVKSSDAHLKGLHRFYSPVVVNGKEYLVKITVKDRTGDGGKNSGLNRYDRLGAYQIIGIETEKAQPKVEPSLPVNVTGASPDAARRPIVEVMNTPRYTADEITVRDMLTGVKRDGDVVYKKETGADGKESWVKDEDKRSRFFVDEPNELAYAEDGGYWRDPTDTTSDMELSQKLQQDRGDVLFQHDRGESEIRGSFNPQTNTLRLTPNADITTFSHEMGHFWLTNAIRLSTLPGSDLSLRRDVRKLMDTWGIKDASEWEKLGTEGQRQYHEQFASWVEEFLATGRVPNDSLRGFFEKMRQWITDLYRDIRSHLNSRYRQEFGKDLPALSDEVRDILERNIAYEDRLAAVQRDFSPTTAQTDAARYATFENVVKNDQLVDRSDAQSLQGSLFAEQQAKDALNNREKVNVNGPMDADMLQGRQDAVKKSLHMPESLEALPKDEGMPVHEITKAEPKPEVQEEGGIAAVVRRVSDALLGKQLEENAAPKEDADVADIMRRSDEVLEKSPDMQLTPDEVSDANDVKPGKTAAEYVAAVDAEAQSIEKFANVMSTAAMCVLRNGGITHA